MVGDVVGLMVGDVVGLAVGGAVGGTADFPPLLLVAEVPSSSPLDLPLPPFALWPRRSRVTDAPWVTDTRHAASATMKNTDERTDVILIVD
jgi:hypothetical protein